MEKFIEELIVKHVGNLRYTYEVVAFINAVKLSLHNVSPFKEEPVDCVIWVDSNNISPNDYNPNTVAPPEMKLLELSIATDGYTQPIVAVQESKENYEVVDGFHRTRVGKESTKIRKRTHGYLPVVVLNPDSNNANNRVAATIRHNRARGKHGVEAMGDIVKRVITEGWSDAKAAAQLGMSAEEVLRLKQVTGFAELFKDKKFSDSWEWHNENPE